MYAFKADAALDAAQAAAANAKEGDGGVSIAAPPLNKKKAVPENREHIQSKLDFATALSSLASGNYQKAAHSILKLGPAKDFGNWIGRVFSLCFLTPLPVISYCHSSSAQEISPCTACCAHSPAWEQVIALI
ncbi:hypothetical protein B0H11DRAFT_1219097 [Mycena galericulata]|nr:hypothetical protein B0H11DRAFT_1219097 [Mycena galericulata]